MNRRSIQAGQSCARSWQQPSRTALRVSLSGSSSGGCQEQVKTQAHLRVQERCDELIVEALGSPPRVLVTGRDSASEQLQHASSPHWEHPGVLTRRIVRSNSVARLREVVAAGNGGVNSIHVAAALVKLAKLARPGAWGHPEGAEQQLHERRDSHSHASSSGHATTSSPRSSRRVPHDTHTDAIQHIPIPPQPSTQDTVRVMAAELSLHYARHAPDYSSARQHANVAWALGQLHQSSGVQPSLSVLTALQDALLASHAQHLRSAQPQELSNLALGLVKLQHHPHALIESIASAAQPQLASFKPQELANLIWALAHTCGLVPDGVDAAAVAAAAPAEPAQAGGAAQAAAAAAWPHTRACVQAALQAAGQQAHRLNPQELANVLTSAVRVGLASDAASQLCGKLLPALLEHARSQALNGQDVSNSLWALVRLRQPGMSQALLDALLADTSSSHTAVSEHSQSEHVAAAGQVGHTASQSAQQQQQRQGRSRQRDRQGLSGTAWLLRQCNAQELATVLWSCAACWHRQSGPGRPADQAAFAGELLAALARKRTRQQLQPRGTAMALWAAARLDLPDTESRLTLLSHAATQASHMGPQEVSNVLWSTSQLPASICAQPRHRDALAALLAAARPHLARYPPPALAQLAWATGWAVHACHHGGWQAENARCPGVPADTSTHHDSSSSYSQDRQLMSHTAPLQPQPDSQPQQPQLQQSATAESQASASQGQQPAVAAECSCKQHELTAWFSSSWQPVLLGLMHQSLLRAHAFSAGDLSVLAQGLSYALPRGEGSEVYHAIGCAACKLLPQGSFTPGGLVSLIAALNRAGAPHRELLAAAAHTAAARPASYSPVQLANLLWSFASSRLDNRQLVHRLAMHLLTGPLGQAPASHTPHASATHTTTTTHTYAHTDNEALLSHTDWGMGHTSDVGVGHTSVGSSESGDSSDDVDLSPSSHSLSLVSQLGWDPDADEEDRDLSASIAPVEGGWRAVQQGLVDIRELPWAQAHETPTSVWAAQAGALDTLYTEPACSSPGMLWTVTTWALARCSYYNHQLYDRMVGAVLASATPPAAASPAVAAEGAGGARQALAALTTPCLVQLLWALATHDHVHPVLLREAAPVLAARIHRGQVRPRDVASVAWSYAKLHHYEPLLFSCILREAQTHTNRYTLRSWSRLTWAFSTLCLPSEEAFFVRLAQLQRMEESRRAQHAQQAPQETTQRRSPSTSTTRTSRPASIRSTRGGGVSSAGQRRGSSPPRGQHTQQAAFTHGPAHTSRHLRASPGVVRGGHSVGTSGSVALVQQQRIVRPMIVRVTEQEWLGRHVSHSVGVVRDVEGDVRLLARPAWHPRTPAVNEQTHAHTQPTAEQ